MKSTTVTTTIKDFDLECGEVVDIEVEYTGHYDFGTCGIDLDDYDIVDNFDDLELTRIDILNLECQCEHDWEDMNEPIDLL